MQIDTLINARWIIPIEPADTVYEHYSLAIDDGKILDILPTAKALEKYTPNTNKDLTNHALLPGFVNTHTHAAMSLFRGLADDLPLMEWLNDHIWPAESKWVDETFVRDGSRHSIAEMIRSGTTCFNDMYFFPDQTAEVAVECGIRACVGLILIDFPTAWASDPQNYIEKGLDVRDKFKHNPLITTAFAPHAPYTVSDEPLQHINTLAEELDIPIHMHVHETGDEILQSIEKYDHSPIKRLENLGLLSERFLAVHMTQLTDQEIEIITKYKINIIHCPESNLKLASGFCPVKKLIDAGVNLALGTDGAASNNDLDMIGEMKTAALLAKGVAEDCTAVSANTALRMATLNGAKALGLADHIGSLEKGKQADVIAIDLQTIETQPLYDPASQIVYAASRNQVSDVWIAGKLLLNDRQLTTIDPEHSLQTVNNWREKIRRKKQI